MLCSKDNLLAAVRTSSALELVLSFVLLVIGVSLVTSTHFRMALGPSVGSAGGGCLFLAILYVVPAWFAHYAAKYHNKFMLLVHTVLLGGIVALQLIIGGATYASALPSFSYDFVGTCLVNAYLRNETLRAACQEYFESDEYAGLMLAWQTYFNETLETQTASNMVTVLQDNSVCCGLGPPEHCRPDYRPFPTTFPSTDAAVRQACSTKSGYYPASPSCYKGGSCAYDYPMGSCGLVGVAGNSMGCAKAFHQHFSYSMRSVSLGLMGMTSLPLLMVLLSLCLLFKRKDEDVLPSMTTSGMFHSRARVYVAGDVRRIERIDF
ncbi:hypothetical protein H310_06489 [Aphanomyces invadans]|uniref:Tetraspanin n=1 Tax=Aphanomyces invadans TaxID=157072 RepID=A0A024U6Y9_9STRA|nr:hypothetical protein H310_06489 [Aphanomyces invadans]ETW01960.1 hypothetical protein H310_06489 [Aphanomyces invadans]|eukprot:XP_008869808.1 hypothetical protein H310_06489 [Aphanomyces invadans]